MAEQKYRLFTRADFDGVVCGALFNELNMINDIVFAEPNDMQQGSVRACRPRNCANAAWDKPSFTRVSLNWAGVTSCKNYRRSLERPDPGGAPFRHATEFLQREQIRSPDHLLGNVALHLRHLRSLGTSRDG